MRALRAREVKSPQQAIQPAHGRWVWKPGWPDSKACTYTLLALRLSSKERLDGHIGSIILATEWRTEVAQQEACNKAGIGKNRWMEKKYVQKDGEGSIQHVPLPSAFNSKMGFWQRGLENKLPVFGNVSKRVKICLGVKICMFTLPLTRSHMPPPMRAKSVLFIWDGVSSLSLLPHTRSHYKYCWKGRMSNGPFYSGIEEVPFLTGKIGLKNKEKL